MLTKIHSSVQKWYNIIEEINIIWTLYVTEEVE